jgi:hypothetical protein
MRFAPSLKTLVTTLPQPSKRRTRCVRASASPLIAIVVALPNPMCILIFASGLLRRHLEKSFSFTLMRG